MDEPPKKALAAKPGGVCKAKAKTEETAVAAAEKVRKKSTTKTAPSATTIKAAPRRRVKVTPLVAPAIEEIESALVEVAPPTKTTRAKKAASKTESKPIAAKVETATKTRAKKPDTEVQQDEVKAVPKSRGRPKKAPIETTEPIAELEKPVRQTRKRAESDLDSSKPIASTVAKSAAMPKKKVTFQDMPDDDKENQPMPARRGAGKKESTTATGLRARPVRKPVAATTRKRAAAGKTETQATRVLTPKKITQVARSTTPLDSDEDELNGGKTPIRDLSQSPKRGILSARSSSPVKKLDFAQTLSTISTLKTSILSPPRRLPQSPFKNSLRESPKRGEGIPVFPALNATLGVSAAVAINSQEEVAFQQSPKRGIFDNSIFSQSTAKVQRSPNKPFLSQSPIRKLFSPTKQSMFSRTPARNENAEVTETAVSSYFRSSQSPVRPAKVHRLSDEELAVEKAQGIDFDESVLNIRSPIKVSKQIADLSEEVEQAPNMAMEIVKDATSTPSTPRGPWSKAEEAELAPNEDEDNLPTQVVQDMDAMATDAPRGDLALTANAASYLLNPYALRAEDDSSEDELQTDETPQRPLFQGRPSLSSKTVRAHLSSGLSKETKSNLGFSPLATQLSGWLATSPEKKAATGDQIQRGMFSPLAAQHVPGEVQIGRQSTPVQQKAGVLRESVGLRESIAARSSLAQSITDSPVASSYFTDEMAARDFEEQVEARESISALDMHVDTIFAEQEQVENTLAQDTNLTLDETVDDNVQLEDNLDEALSTTGVLEDPAMTDTALLDFVHIAQEAEELAPSMEKHPHSSASSEYGDENTITITRPEVSIAEETHASEVPSSPEVLQPEIVVLTESKQEAFDYNTPVRPDLSQPRFANTVVSKVPLRPEGHMLPIKVNKKRSRSLSACPGSAKRPLLDSGAFLIPKSNTVISFSPERQDRSPVQSVAASTPGQMSFAVDDFGDSTLDSIQIPDESEEEIEDSIMSKIPGSVKSPKIRSTVATPARKPLKAVGTGVLHGAVVYVDVHTTEGADASGIFVDLLTQMGAKCVREWKWNPRAGLAVDDVENMVTPARIGITHVVYKDGGKRTLEKVRDARGEVCCVGVGWVLEWVYLHSYPQQSVLTCP
jgi:hypothetical protein